MWMCGREWVSDCILWWRVLGCWAVEGTTEILERNKGKGIDWNHRFQDLLSR
jgi:hypothetical protein